MKKKPTKAVAKVVTKIQRLIDDFGRLEAQYPGAFDDFMARGTQNRKKAAAASAKKAATARWRKRKLAKGD